MNINRRIEGGYEVGALATSSRRRISECRNIIKAFIAELPDDLTVLEIREAIEDSDA